jgi:hypothetical protein
VIDAAARVVRRERRRRLDERQRRHVDHLELDVEVAEQQVRPRPVAQGLDHRWQLR